MCIYIFFQNIFFCTLPIHGDIVKELRENILKAADEGGKLILNRIFKNQ